MTLAEFATQWPGELRRYRRGCAAALRGVIPVGDRRGIEKRARNSGEKLLKTWLEDPRHCRQILELREVDLLPKAYKAMLRKRAVERIRTDISSKLRARYKTQSEGLAKFFAQKLVSALEKGATVRARDRNGMPATLMRPDIQEALPDIDENLIASKHHKWFSITVTLPVADTAATPLPREHARVTLAPPPVPTGREMSLLASEARLTPASPQAPTYAPTVTYSPAQVPEAFNAWARDQHKAGIIITYGLAEDAMRGTDGLLIEGTGLSRETIRAWVKSLPSDWTAKRGEPPSRRKSI